MDNVQELGQEIASLSAHLDAATHRPQEHRAGSRCREAVGPQPRAVDALGSQRRHRPLPGAKLFPDGRSLVYASSRASRFTLHLKDLDTSADKALADDDGAPFFSFSRDGKRVAYLAAISFQPVPQGKLTVLDIGGGAPPRTLLEEPVLASFWDPNRRTIAFITPDTSGDIDAMFAPDNGLFLQIMGYDTVSQKTWLIARFPPSRGVLSVIPYLDQYGRSATIWSPDSRFISFTAMSAEGYPALYVARADGNLKPRFLLAGDYAFWSGK